MKKFTILALTMSLMGCDRLRAEADNGDPGKITLAAEWVKGFEGNKLYVEIRNHAGTPLMLSRLLCENISLRPADESGVVMAIEEVGVPIYWANNIMIEVPPNGEYRQLYDLFQGWDELIEAVGSEVNTQRDQVVRGLTVHRIKVKSGGVINAVYIGGKFNGVQQRIILKAK